MKKIHYVVLFCLLIVGLFTAWYLCKTPKITEDDIQLMSLFQTDDDFDGVIERLETIALILNATEHEHNKSEEFKKVYRPFLRYSVLRNLSEEQRQAYWAQEGYVRDHKLTDEEMEYLNQLIKTKKITMDTP